MEKVNREIIVYKLYPHHQNESLGFLRAVAEEKDGDYIPLNAKNFCYSEKVFVPADYDKINRKYQDYELFKISISQSSFLSKNVSPDKNCTYVGLGTHTKSMKPRELIEVIKSPLPDANDAVISLTHIPSTSYIYIQDKGVCYGPFNWKTLAEAGKVSIETIKSPLPGRTLPLGRIFSGQFSELADKHALDCPLPEHARYYFKKLADLHNDTLLSSMDYYSDAEIVQNFIKVTKDMRFRGNQNLAPLNFLLQRVRQNPASKHARHLARIDRISDMASEQALFDKKAMESFERFFNTDNGQKILQHYIEDNKVTYLANLKSDYQAQLEIELESTLQDLNRINTDINNNKRTLSQLQMEIEEANQLKLDAQLEKNRQQITHLDNEIRQKKQNLNQLTENYQRLSDKYQHYQTLDDVQLAIQKLEGDYEQVSERNLFLQQQTTQINENYQLSEAKLKSKLMNLKTFVDVIQNNGQQTPINKQNNPNNLSDNEINKTSTIDTLKQADILANIAQTLQIEQTYQIDNTHIEDIKIEHTHPQNEQHQNHKIAHYLLQSLQHSFEQEHRPLSMLDIINLVITVQQSFICFLAGLPGGGKTTLARLIAKVQNIQHPQKFLEIPVARGWTGQKDLLGFFNPITNQFQPSPTGLYQFLSTFSDTVNNNHHTDTSLSMVLLDEANLSAMEYYWSSFMSLSDSLHTQNDHYQEIKLANTSLMIPPQLRFISTINYDSTTESLSPRMIDRAPIIVIESNSITEKHFYSSTQQSASERSTLDKPIDYQLMDELFGKTAIPPALTDDETSCYQQIKQLLEKRDSQLGKPVLISNRKEVAIRQYCHKARPLMQVYHQSMMSADSDIKSNIDNTDIHKQINTFIAFDFAVLQFILPLLKGHGHGFRERLIQLRDIFDSARLQRSHRYINMMISNGDADLRTYDFFCW